MSTFGIRNAFSTRFLTVSLVGVLSVGSLLSADKHASAPAPKPAAAPHPSGGGGGSHPSGGGGASHPATDRKSVV